MHVSARVIQEVNGSHLTLSQTPTETDLSRMKSLEATGRALLKEHAIASIATGKNTSSLRQARPE